MIKYDYIKNNSADWQAQLERISDFLIFGENKWWEKNEFGIKFFDVDHIPDKSHHPKIHHFRSSSITSISNDLEMLGVPLWNKEYVFLSMKFYLGMKMKLFSIKKFK